MHDRWRVALVATVVLASLAGCSGNDDGGGTAAGTKIGGVAANGGPLAWPAPPASAVARVVQAAGLELEHKESLIHHVHAHLDVFIDGKHRTVPGGLGIVITDAAVHTGTVHGRPAYGGIAGCDQPCISPLHTHDASGVIHTESATSDDNTLGELFTEWGVKLTAKCIGTDCTPGTPISIYVDGKATPLRGAGDTALTEGREIAVVIGVAPPRIPSEGDFSGA